MMSGGGDGRFVLRYNFGDYVRNITYFVGYSIIGASGATKKFFC